MKYTILFLLFCVLSFRVEGLEGKALYDYQVLFLNTYWNQTQWQPAIDSILNSAQWKTMDAQYGPYVSPTTTTTTTTTAPAEKK